MDGQPRHRRFGTMSRPQTSFFSIRIRWWGLLSAVGALGIAGTVAGFAGRFIWFCDLAANFRVQYFVVLLVGTVLSAAGRRYRSAVLYGAMAGVNLAVILPLYFCENAPSAPADAIRARAVLLNVHTENRRFDLVRGFVEAEKPDFIVFEEIDDEWLRELSKLSNLYPNIVPAPRSDNFGIALFSRWRLHNFKIRDIGGNDVPTVQAYIDVRGKLLSVVGTHPLPPANREQFTSRNRQLSEVAALVRTLPKPIVLLGDLNATPWSPYYQRFLEEAKLREGLCGHGLNASWPAPYLPLWIPIDRCLTSPDVAVTRVKVGPNVGSDHFPIIVDLVF
jgi:endonuclease/exonuclease/phosphatase (EEP) superfamily protein YafD